MSVSRREFLQVSAAAMAGAEMSMHAQSAPPTTSLSSVKALVFDTFGTVVDWRSSVAREVEALAKCKGVALDAADQRLPVRVAIAVRDRCGDRGHELLEPDRTLWRR